MIPAIPEEFPKAELQASRTKAIKVQFTDDLGHHVYRLGLGPCGRVVVRLRLNVDRNGDYEVYQWVEGETHPLLIRYPRRNVLRISDYPYSDEVCAL